MHTSNKVFRRLEQYFSRAIHQLQAFNTTQIEIFWWEQVTPASPVTLSHPAAVRGHFLAYLAIVAAPSHHQASTAKSLGTVAVFSIATPVLSFARADFNTSLGATITPPLTPARIVR